MPKVLFIHHGTGIGGAAISLMQMVKELRLNKKYETKLVFMENSDAVGFFKNHQIDVNYVLNITSFSHTVIWSYNLLKLHHALIAFVGIFKTFYFAHQILKKEKPDIVHLNSSPAWPWAIICHLMSIPVICHIREPFADGYFGFRRQLIIWIISRFSTKILSISKYDGTPFVKSLKLMVLYNSVDPDRFDISQKLNLQKKRMVFLFVGGALREKGSMFVLELWVLLKILTSKMNLEMPQLLIAGQWTHPSTGFLARALHFFGLKTPQEKFYQELDQLASTFRDSISFCGLEKKIENKMILADYLLFPCQIGHFARPVIEAAFLKVPSIASKLAPLDELIIDSQTGFLLSHENTLEWANLILKLMLAPDQYQYLQKGCFEFSINKFSLKNQIRKLTQVYSEVIKADGTSI